MNKSMRQRSQLLSRWVSPWSSRSKAKPFACMSKTDSLKSSRPILLPWARLKLFMGLLKKPLFPYSTTRRSSTKFFKLLSSLDRRTSNPYLILTVWSQSPSRARLLRSLSISSRQEGNLTSTPWSQWVISTSSSTTSLENRRPHWNQTAKSLN